jgi:hypothetical protein
MKEIFFYAEKRGGYLLNPSNFEKDWLIYDKKPILLKETAGYEMRYSPVKKMVYIEPTEYGCGTIALNKKDLMYLLKLMKRKIIVI